MASVAFDTLKLAQRLEAAGFPAKQAQDMASAIADTIIETVVTRDYFDLRIGELRGDIDGRFGELRGDIDGRFAEFRGDIDGRFRDVHRDIGELRADTGTRLAELRAEMLKWMFGAVGLQTLAILGGLAALLKLIGH